MKKYFVFISAMLVILANSCGPALNQENLQAVSAHELTLKVFETGRKHCELDFYAGTLMLHAMSEFALLKGNEAYLDTVVRLFEKFSNGEISARGNFISYKAGGSGAAFLSWKNATDKLVKQVAVTADKLMNEQNRTPDNLMTAPWATNEMFIDVTFPITPFLLYTGLELNNQEYIDYTVFQTMESFRILDDESTGLVHQGRGFQGEGSITKDCWSRGNGWGAFALAILVIDLPESHPKRKEVEDLAVRYFTSIIEHQNEQGLWYQEMTAPESYVETSGSGLMLYSLGLVLEKGLLEKKYMANFEKGIQNYVSYIGSDGSISHCAYSSSCVVEGTKEAYIKHPWVYNDHHAFGPALLTLIQAHKMGYSVIRPAEKLGKYTIGDTPDEPRTYVRKARGSDLAWENDRIAFRIFGPSVRHKVANGIDVWAKSVEYPILDKRYTLWEKEGKDYHVDWGEGCDFYNMGKRSGCGGIAIWKDGKPYRPETFDSFTLIQNQNDKIKFDVQYLSWEVPGMEVTEQKTFQMASASNLFQVTSTIQSKLKEPITVAIGLSTIQDSEIFRHKETGILSIWEAFEGNGKLGTAILANPEDIVGFESYEGDEFILIKAETNTPFTYYAGAGWDKSEYFSNQDDWLSYLKVEAENISH